MCASSTATVTDLQQQPSALTSAPVGTSVLSTEAVSGVRGEVRGESRGRRDNDLSHVVCRGCSPTGHYDGELVFLSVRSTLGQKGEGVTETTASRRGQLHLPVLWPPVQSVLFFRLKIGLLLTC